MKITFLGTGSMVPTIERNHSSILFNYNSENILVDCGEGTQKQLRKAKISPAKITRILITHWHGDHVLGIPGLLSTLRWSNYTKTLEIYGPKGTKKYFSNMMNGFDSHILPTLKVKLIEINKKLVFENKDFYVETLPVVHTKNCLAYNFIEKDKRRINLSYLKKFGLKNNPILKSLSQGKDIVYNGKKISAKKATILNKGRKLSIVLDTIFFPGLYKIAKNSDLFVCESTHLSREQKESNDYEHLTSEQAAITAKKAKVKKLILTHFSQRYKDVMPLEKEAKKIFKNTITAKDLMTINV
ncbi:MAG: ribonuclease Z [Candidatus Nanoarchaeia archaeon]|nr:ribonuclease Z [Candidatus Nanoarchaeia archaeon]